MKSSFSISDVIFFITLLYAHTVPIALLPTVYIHILHILILAVSFINSFIQIRSFFHSIFNPFIHSPTNSTTGFLVQTGNTVPVESRIP